MKILQQVLFLIVTFSPLAIFSQVSDATIDKWAIEMKSLNDNGNVGSIPTGESIIYGQTMRNIDSAYFLFQKVLNSPKADFGNKMFRFRMMHLKLSIYQADSSKRNFATAKPMIDSVLLLAYQTADPQAIALANWTYGNFYYVYQDLETAVTFCSRGLQQLEGFASPGTTNSHNCVLGEMMFHAGEYRLAISHTLKGLPYIKAHNLFPHFFISRYYNTVGQAYQNLSMPDSALFYFNTSTRWARDHGDSTWVSINALNIGEIYLETPQWRQSKALFYEAYTRNKAIDRPMETSALLGLGNWYLKNRQMDSAQWYLSACIQMSLDFRTADNSLRMDNYRRRALDGISNLYIELGRPDVYYTYRARYRRLNDSLNRVALLSSIKSVELRNKAMNDELAIERLQDEKENEKWIRNLIIFIILGISGAVIIYLNKQRRILRLETQAGQLKQEAADKELVDARRQLAEFTQSLQEKSLLLDRLKEQAVTAANQDQYQEVVDELTQQTILTEDDWQKFRGLFEKIEPHFFPKLRSAYPEITIAELRLAALTLLQIDNRQMAAMLGISADSVRKSRQRLRQRLQVDTETDLYQFLSQI